MNFTAEGWAMSNDSEEKLKALLEYIPKTTKELRSSLGMINYLKCGYGHPGTSLSEYTWKFYDLLTECEKFGKKKLEPEIEPESWRELVEEYNPRLLGYTSFEAHQRFALTVDASDQCLAGALFVLPADAPLIPSSDILNHSRLIDVFSRRFAQAEANWPVYERESLAIYESLTRWHQILWQAHCNIVIFTDSLVALRQWEALRPPTKVQSQRRWLSWHSELSFYDLKAIKLIHIDGTLNSLADLLTRILPEVFLGEDTSPTACLTTTSQDYIPNHESQRRAMATIPSISADLNPMDPTLIEAIKRLQAEDTNLTNVDDPKFVLISGLWHYTDFDVSGFSDYGSKAILYIPDGTCDFIDKRLSLRLHLIKTVHETTHAGWRTTHARLREDFYWDSIQPDCKRFVKDCGTCGVTRKETSQTITDRVIKKRPVSSNFKHIYVDHFHFNDLICVTFICSFSGFVQFSPVKTESSAETALTALRWISVFGTPATITSDRGAAYDSEVWKNVMNLLNVKPNFTCVANPRANLAERPHRMLRHFCNISIVEKQDTSWEAILCFAALAWNTRRSTDISPSKLCFGMQITDPLDCMIHHNDRASEVQQTPIDSEFALEIKKYIDLFREEHRRTKFDDYLSATDPITPVPFSIGDRVRLPSKMELGEIIQCGDWSVLVKWPSGHESWQSPGQLRRVSNRIRDIEIKIYPNEFYIAEQDGFYLAKVFQLCEEYVYVEWWDNYGTSTYRALEGFALEWIRISQVVCHVELTSSFRINERSRQKLQSLNIL